MCMDSCFVRSVCRTTTSKMLLFRMDFGSKLQYMHVRKKKQRQSAVQIFSSQTIYECFHSPSSRLCGTVCSTKWQINHVIIHRSIYLKYVEFRVKWPLHLVLFWGGCWRAAQGCWLRLHSSCMFNAPQHGVNNTSAQWRQEVWCDSFGWVRSRAALKPPPSDRKQVRELLPLRRPRGTGSQLNKNVK